MSKAKKNSELLREAIADARALREISVDNAKTSLLERFTPKLKQIVHDHMLEASEDEDEGAEDESGNDDTEPLELDLDGGDDGEGDEALSDEEIDEISEYLAEKADDRHSDTDDADDHSNSNPHRYDDEMLDLTGIETGYDNVLDDAAELDELRDRLGIDEIIANLTEEGHGMDDTEVDEIVRDVFREMEHEDDEYYDDDMDEVVDIDLSEYGVTSLDRDPMGLDVGSDGTYIDLVDDMFDDADDYTSFDPEGAAATVQEPAADPLDEVLDLSDIVLEMDGEGRREDTRYERDRGGGSLKRENRRIREKLDRYRKAVGILRDQLRESKLVTKKLQYTNRLFNNTNMNSRERSRVVESFDRAETPREIKLTYRNLRESIQGSNRGDAKRLNESRRGGASKRQASTKPDTRTINESTDLRERFQELADIL